MGRVFFAEDGGAVGGGRVGIAAHAQWQRVQAIVPSAFHEVIVFLHVRVAVGFFVAAILVCTVFIAIPGDRTNLAKALLYSVLVAGFIVRSCFAHDDEPDRECRGQGEEVCEGQHLSYGNRRRLGFVFDTIETDETGEKEKRTC